MGRASRTKKSHRVGRRWSTIDPDSGATKTFTVFVDDTALRQWERERGRLRAGGYPDRPPEVDTPNVRMWSDDGQPIRSTDIDGAFHALGADPSARAIGIWRSSSPGGEFGIKLNVGRREDGVYVVNLVAESLDGFRWSGIAVATTPEELHERTKAYAEVVRSLGLPEPTWISTDALLGEVASEACGPSCANDAA